MISSILLLLSATLISSTTATSTTTTSLFLIDTDPQPFDASIIAYNPAPTPALTYSINCPPGEDADACGLGPGATIALQGSLYDYTVTASGIAVSIHCELAGTTSALCTESFGGSEANFPGIETVTYQGTEMSYLPVTITAGLERLTEGVSAAATSTQVTMSSAAQGAVGAVASTTVPTTTTTSATITALPTPTYVTSSSEVNEINVSDILDPSSIYYSLLPSDEYPTTSETVTSSASSTTASLQTSTTVAAQSTGTAARGFHAAHGLRLGAVVGIVCAHFHM